MSATPRLRAGVIGPSGIGRAHIDALRRLGIEVSAVAGATEPSGPDWAARLGIAAGCETAEQLVVRDDVDVVHVCTPNAYHAQQALAAIAAGKHVVCEKPLATSSAEARRMLDAARDAGIRHAVAYNYRHFTMVRRLRDEIASGSLGRVHLVRGSWLSDELLRTANAEHWMFDPSTMGAWLTMSDIGVHLWDLVQYVTGCSVVEVMCTRQMASGHLSGEDSVTMLLRLEDNAVAVMALSGAAPGHGNGLELEVIGLSGSASWRQEDPDCLDLGAVGSSVQRVLRSEADSRWDAPLAPRMAAGHIEGFLDAFRDLIGAIYAGFVVAPGSRDYPTFEDGVAGLRILEALVESADSRQWVQI